MGSDILEQGGMGISLTLDRYKGRRTCIVIEYLYSGRHALRRERSAAGRDYGRGELHVQPQVKKAEKNTRNDTY